MLNSINAIKSPPEFSEERGYEHYKKELQVWQLLKVCSKKEEGPLIFRTLTGRAKSAVIDLSVAEIGGDDGLDKILARLDGLYLADKNQRIFQALDTFEKYRRPSSMTMSNFILEFQKLHNTVSTYKCIYPDGVLAYRLLKAASISSEHEQLCRATIGTGEWSYKTLVEQLNKIFNDVQTVQTSTPAIKVEPVFHTRMEKQSCLPRYDSRNPYETERTRLPREAYAGSLYDDYNDEENYHMPPEINEGSRSERSHFTDGGDEYDIYYTPTSDRRSNSWKRYGKQSFQRPRGYQRARFIDDPSARSGLRSSYNSSKTAMNPKDARGNYTTCRRCRSIYHWFEDCPHISEDEKSNRESRAYYGNTTEEEIYIGLFQSNLPNSSDEISCLLGETLDMAVIDSGCPKTVCGQDWYNEYIKSRPDIQSSDIQCLESKALFRFGDSKPISAIKKVLLPLNIAEKDILLETEVVPSNVPLLLSKETMKKANARLNFDKDTISLFGVEQVMVCTTSGHYAIPIKKHNVYSCNRNSKEDNLILFSLKENADVKTVAKKLHQQFSHPVADRLIKLVKNAGVENADLIEAIKDVGSHCDTCKRYKKSNPRPVVSLPLASEFNDTIAMDLKTYRNNEIYFMHVIDHATRFSAASVIRSKKKEVIVGQFFKHWVAVFGSPRRILSDNGGEFANSEFIEMCENLNVNFLTTAAESPWSNGLVEKHNHIIGEAVYKIMEDINCSVEIALCWAVNAKNSLQSVYGFSPHQLVFGRNPNLPSAFENKLPALEGVTGSKLIAANLNALHKAREEFIKLESSEKIRRAMRAKTRTHSNVTYFSGDDVFYKRDDETRWKGPGRVIGHDGSKILIKIPTGLISVHSCRVMLTSYAEENRLTLDTLNNQQETQSMISNTSKEIEVDVAENELQFGVEDDNIRQNEGEENNQQNVGLNETLSQNEQVDDHQNEDEVDNQHEDQVNVQNEDHLNVSRDGIIPQQNIQAINVNAVEDLPKINQCVQYRIPDSYEWKNAKVTGRAGKVTGVNRFWLNIKNLDSDVDSSLDFKNGVMEWRPLKYQVMLTSLKDDRFEEAREKELSNWSKLKVYQEIDNVGQKSISARWVYNEKVIDGEIVKKARLVCRGFEEDSEGIRTDSPTCYKDTLRVATSIISAKEWEINSLDVKAAFLQGKELERDIFMKPPKEAKVPGKLWKLRRCVYGLNDASRYWYFRLRDQLLKSGCKCSKLDPSLFIFHKNSTLHGILIIHVDDILWSGTEHLRMEVIEELRSTFKISSESRSAFKYIGLEVTHDEKGIYLSQKEYADEVEEVEIDKHRKCNTNLPLNGEERDALRSLIGKLNWLSTQTRPDLAYAVSELGSSLKNATIKHLIQANRVVRRCKQHDVHMFFPKLNLNDIKVRCYGDASFGKLEDGGSQGGVFVELVSEDKTSPVAWYSKRIRRIVKSTMAAETLAMAEAVEAGHLISALTSEILYEGVKKIPVEAVTDNYSLYESAHSTKSNSDRRLRIDLGILRESITKEELTLNWVPTSNQLSDVLTKHGVNPSVLLSHISA